MQKMKTKKENIKVIYRFRQDGEILHMSLEKTGIDLSKKSHSDLVKASLKAISFLLMPKLYNSKNYNLLCNFYQTGKILHMSLEKTGIDLTNKEHIALVRNSLNAVGVLIVAEVNNIPLDKIEF